MNTQPVQCKVCGSYEVVRNDDHYQLFTCKRCKSHLYINPDTSEQKTISELMKQLQDYACRHDTAALISIASKLKNHLPNNYQVEFFYQLSVNRLSPNGDDRQYRKFLGMPFVAPTDDDMIAILPFLYNFSRIEDFNIVSEFLKSGKVIGLNDKQQASLLKEVSNKKAEFSEKLKNDHARYPRDVFICHANNLDAIASAVADELEGKGISCWYDHRNLPETTQDDYTQRIREQIVNCKVFLLIAKSIENITKSVETELIWAQERNSERKSIFIVGYFLNDNDSTDNVWDHVTVKHVFSMASSLHNQDLGNVFFYSIKDVVKAVEKRYIHCCSPTKTISPETETKTSTHQPKTRPMRRTLMRNLIISLILLTLATTAVYFWQFTGSEPVPTPTPAPMSILAASATTVITSKPTAEPTATPTEEPTATPSETLLDPAGYSSYTAIGKPGVTNSTLVRFRTAPDTSDGSNIMFQVALGSEVWVHGSFTYNNTDWAYIRYATMDCYVWLNLLDIDVNSITSTPTLSPTSALSSGNSTEHLIPKLEAVSASFRERNSFNVYTAPNDSSYRVPNAQVTTIYTTVVYGVVDDWVLVSYTIGYNNLKGRIGYIKNTTLSEPDTVKKLEFANFEATVTRNVSATDDPIYSGTEIFLIERGKTVTLLAFLQDEWAYVETTYLGMQARVFIPSSSIIVVLDHKSDDYVLANHSRE